MEEEIHNEQQQQKQQLEETMMKKQDDVVRIELPAPSGWKKYAPKKGGTPRRNAIVFVSPTGEEIKSKTQLDRYLKAHPGGPSASEFDWGTGDTPRRSARLTGKAKVTESPEIETPKKKQRKSSSKKEAKDMSDMEDEGDAAEGKKLITEESVGSPEVEMADGVNAGGRDDGEIISKEVQPDNVNGADKKSVEGKTVTGMPLANEDNVGINQNAGVTNDEVNVDEKIGEITDELKLEEKTGESNDEPNVKKDDTQEAENKPSVDVKEENTDSKSLAPSAGKESDEVTSDPSKPEVASDLPLQNEVAEAEPVNDAANSKAEEEYVGDSGDAIVGQAEHPQKETTRDDAEAAPVDADNLKDIQKANNSLEDHAVAGDQGASS